MLNKGTKRIKLSGSQGNNALGMTFFISLFLAAGHYVSFAKNYINGKWYEFNDSWVSEGKLANTAYFIRDLFTLRRGRLQVRDFLNTEYCSRVNQRHFGGKT